MEKKYIQVPDILTGKDLDYLSDMFEWNYGALKKSNDAIIKVTNEEIKEVMKEACTIFQTNMELVLNILQEAQTDEQ